MIGKPPLIDLLWQMAVYDTTHKYENDGVKASSSVEARSLD